MDAFILAGGKGTRLRPYTTVLPKPLMPLGDTPILDVILRQLDFHNFKDIVISTGYLAALIETFCENQNYSRLNISYALENTPLGTAGPIRLVEQQTNSFIMMNGDILSDFNFAKFIDYHKKSNNLITVGVYNRQDVIPLGVVELSPKGEIINYKEKPIINNFVSMGIYALKPEVTTLIPKNTKFDMPNLIKSILDDGKIVGSYLHNGFWLDIGNHEDYAKAQDDFIEINKKIFG